MRAYLLTLAEYERARERLTLVDRVVLSLFYRVGLRPGECARIAPADLWL